MRVCSTLVVLIATFTLSACFIVRNTVITQSMAVHIPDLEGIYIVPTSGEVAEITLNDFNEYFVSGYDGNVESVMRVRLYPLGNRILAQADDPNEQGRLKLIGVITIERNSITLFTKSGDLWPLASSFGVTLAGSELLGDDDNILEFLRAFSDRATDDQVIFQRSG